MGLSDEEDDSELLEDSEDDASIDAAVGDEDHLADLDDDLEELNAFELDLQRAIDIFWEQRVNGNKKSQEYIHAHFFDDGKMMIICALKEQLDFLQTLISYMCYKRLKRGGSNEVLFAAWVPEVGGSN